MSLSIEKLLFTTASCLGDAKERRAFLDYACRDDAALRTRLDALLEFQFEADTFFEFQPQVQQPETAASAQTEEGIGARISHYRLITRAGAGGCGIVYLAQQEEPVRRKVALKIIKLGMDTEAVIARFDLERQALAQMEHPNIARVLDAGATTSGRPYFVMEFVDGERITDFCDTNHFSIRRRLELFVQICRAIQHAHQKGIIHRDVKPSNVLVHWHEEIAVPKVIDFGIAKAAAASTGKEITVHFDQFIGTPAYMSPEQAQGSGDLDTRTDIYSLGVLLYELVCGQIPFDLRRFTESGMDEVRRVVREIEPNRPSIALKTASPEKQQEISEKRGTDRRELAAQLADDLDWIVMKAMEKDRARRYDSATGLAMDVERYLKNEAVLARPPSRTYLLGKLLQRNKLVFTAGSIAVFGLLLGFGVSTWMYFQERSARQEQELLRQKAELRELIAHAAVKAKYGDLEGADELLAKVPIDQTPSSLEAANTFALVADWHAHQGRLKKSAERFSSTIRALASVDNSDIPEVSQWLLPVAATVADADQVDHYEEIRRIAIARFGSTTNPQVAEQTLKGCLLMPADAKTLSMLAPLPGMVKLAIANQEGTIGRNPYNTAWACFAISLWYYRSGDLAKADEWAQRCLDSPDKLGVRITSTQIVRAMIRQQTGQHAQASDLIAQASASVNDAFNSRRWLTDPWPVIWFDWVNAAVLLNEAERVVDRK